MQEAHEEFEQHEACRLDADDQSLEAEYDEVTEHFDEGAGCRRRWRAGDARDGDAQPGMGQGKGADAYERDRVDTELQQGFDELARRLADGGQAMATDRERMAEYEPQGPDQRHPE